MAGKCLIIRFIQNVSAKNRVRKFQDNAHCQTLVRHVLPAPGMESCFRGRGKAFTNLSQLFSVFSLCPCFMRAVHGRRGRAPDAFFRRPEPCPGAWKRTAPAFCAGAWKRTAPAFCPGAPGRVATSFRDLCCGDERRDTCRAGHMPGGTHAGRLRRDVEDAVASFVKALERFRDVRPFGRFSRFL